MFLSLNGKNLGYEPARVTPYMHAMVYHVPYFMEKHNGIKKFTGQGRLTLIMCIHYVVKQYNCFVFSILIKYYYFIQGVEKLNDDCRRVHLRRSNKWDAPVDVLRVGKRVEHLSHCERQTRPYQKRNNDYWETMIKDSRSKRLRVSGPIEEQVEANDIESLTAVEIKQKLKDLGITTKLRNLKKLRELLRESSFDKENVPNNQTLA